MTERTNPQRCEIGDSFRRISTDHEINCDDCTAALNAEHAREQRRPDPLADVLVTASSGGRRLEITTTERGIHLALMDGPIIVTHDVARNTDTLAAVLHHVIATMTLQLTRRQA